jgi:hypothetical protein
LTLPEGAPLAAAKGKRSSQTTAAISEPDIAEHYFPSDRRSSIATGLIVLVGMWVFLVGLVHLVLRARDVH